MHFVTLWIRAVILIYLYCFYILFISFVSCYVFLLWVSLFNTCTSLGISLSEVTCIFLVSRRTNSWLTLYRMLCGSFYLHSFYLCVFLSIVSVISFFSLSLSFFLSLNKEEQVTWDTKGSKSNDSSSLEMVSEPSCYSVFFHHFCCIVNWFLRYDSLLCVFSASFSLSSIQLHLHPQTLLIFPLCFNIKVFSYPSLWSSSSPSFSS